MTKEMTEEMEKEKKKLITEKMTEEKKKVMTEEMVKEKKKEKNLDTAFEVLILDLEHLFNDVPYLYKHLYSRCCKSQELLDN